MLQALVSEYIESAHPVGSKTLANRYLIHVSSATVRNELMWLEHHGYIISPHTSAGRVPTNVGYRSFVNSLLLHRDVLHVHTQLTGVKGSQDFLFPTLVNSMSNKEPLEFLSVVTETLMFLSSYVGCLAVTWMPSMNPAIIHRGLAMLMTQPEFKETSIALPLVQLLESHGDLVGILKDVQNTPGLHIRIGTEHEDTQLFAFSMVASRVLVDGNAGVIALFGPTRMDYRKAIGALGAAIYDWEKQSEERNLKR